MNLSGAGRRRNNRMKKMLFFVIFIISLISTALVCSAADGNVTYSGNAGEFIFSPGTEHSPTDLFDNFKNVMPGDTITQKITVKNNADGNVKAEIFLRSFGADEKSEDFLSKLKMYVKKSDGSYIFSDSAEKPFALDKPVSLGVFLSGEVTDIEVILEVPVELDNSYSSSIGKIKWEFSVREMKNIQISNEPSENHVSGNGYDSRTGSEAENPIFTGDGQAYYIYFLIMTVSLIAVVVSVKKNTGK